MYCKCKVILLRWNLGLCRFQTLYAGLISDLQISNICKSLATRIPVTGYYCAKMTLPKSPGVLQILKSSNNSTTNQYQRESSSIHHRAIITHQSPHKIAPKLISKTWTISSKPLRMSLFLLQLQKQRGGMATLNNKKRQGGRYRQSSPISRLKSGVAVHLWWTTSRVHHMLTFSRLV
jgi:hypothetical protein